MRILVLGGTSFVGRAIVEEALRHGTDVTIFSRGRTGTSLFPAVPRLAGDRDTGDYAALREGSWDAVVDVSGYVPRHVWQAMDALGDRAGRYLFISSHAVYRDEGLQPGSDEETPRREPLRDTENLAGGNYGRLKVACEDDVTARYGSRATIVRPGKVAGPHDWQDGLIYYVRRAARGGRLALPADPRQPVQVIDSRDLARLVVCLLTDSRPGAFHAVGPASPTTLGGLIETCARVAGTEVEVVPVPPGTAPAFFPLIRPVWATQQRSAARARLAGMPATPLEVTVADVLAWDRQRGEPPLTRGFSPEQERTVLAQAEGGAPLCMRLRRPVVGTLSAAAVGLQDRLEFGHPRVAGAVAVDVELPLERRRLVASPVDPLVERAERVGEPVRRATHDCGRRALHGRQVDRGKAVAFDGRAARDPQRSGEPKRQVLVGCVLVQGKGQPVEPHLVLRQRGVQPTRVSCSVCAASRARASAWRKRRIPRSCSTVTSSSISWPTSDNGTPRSRRTRMRCSRRTWSGV
jgi:nucleoside-diphosphate-sugar epimerase